MKNNDLNAIWTDIEIYQNIQGKFLQRLVYVDLLHRAYIGISGIQGKRFLAIEILEKDKEQFSTFTAPQGFTLSFCNPSVKHDGYVACVLQAASADQNDVFAIVAKDILEDLKKQKEADKYIDSLKKRIEKWRCFFKNSVKNKLTEKMVIGLIGELSFIQDLIEKGIRNASDLWNGPIKAAQDFQGDKIAVEVKTTSAANLDYVHISSEIQLENSDWDALFLVVYRVERNDSTGMNLPELIQQVYNLLNEKQRARFCANLTCMGYQEEDALLYTKRYTIKECKVFTVESGFPRIIRADLPSGVMDIGYRISLQLCDEFSVNFGVISQAIKEYEYGQS